MAALTLTPDTLGAPSTPDPTTQPIMSSCPRCGCTDLTMRRDSGGCMHYACNSCDYSWCD
jgi:hypothetical protein